LVIEILKIIHTQIPKNIF